MISSYHTIVKLARLETEHRDLHDSSRKRRLAFIRNEARFPWWAHDIPPTRLEHMGCRNQMTSPRSMTPSTGLEHAVAFKLPVSHDRRSNAAIGRRGRNSGTHAEGPSRAACFVFRSLHCAREIRPSTSRTPFVLEDIHTW